MTRTHRGFYNLTPVSRVLCPEFSLYAYPKWPEFDARADC